MTVRLLAEVSHSPRRERCLAVWFPDWPITAWALADGESMEHPVATITANQVVACSPAARAEGVRWGQRRREAQSRCPQLQILAADEARDAREFEAVVRCLEQLSPGVQVVAPGLCLLRAEGLAGYLGDEAQAAETLLEAVIGDLGIETGRIGVADTVFAAVQATRSGEPVCIVSPGATAAFLAPLPIMRLGDARLSELLPRLGVRTLGEFAALDAGLVRDRFGSAGQRLHGLAAGVDSRSVNGRTPPPELSLGLDFEPPLTLIEQVAFASRAMVERFVKQLGDAGLVVTEVRVELATENDEFCAKTWASPTSFEAAGLLDRIRWQAQAAAGTQITAAITAVKLEPVAVDDAAHHEPGLFGLGPDERVHHAMSRVQSMLGPDQVLRPRIAGGRWLAERQEMLPWGDRPLESAPVDRPWPGQLPAPLPATVFPEPLRARLLSADGTPVSLDDRGQLAGIPVRLWAEGTTRVVIEWAGPWPVDERFWDAARYRSASRFQIVDGDGLGWLLYTDSTGWWVEARYD